jgi:hypothetical protein
MVSGGKSLIDADYLTKVPQVRKGRPVAIA